MKSMVEVSRLCEALTIKDGFFFSTALGFVSGQQQKARRQAYALVTRSISMQKRRLARSSIPMSQVQTGVFGKLWFFRMLEGIKVRRG